MKLSFQVPNLSSIFATIFLPTLAATAFALVSYPELMTSLVSYLGMTTERDDGVLSDVRTLAIVIGFLSTFGSISYAKREMRSLREVNKDLQDREVELKKATETLQRRDVEWTQFRVSAFEGLKQVLDAYLRNFCIAYYSANSEEGKPPASLRISIYTHDKPRNVCYLVGRYSPTISYNGAGRREYPIDTGAIGRAWDKIDADIELEKNWASDPLGWARELETKYKMGRDVIEGLSMKSQAFLSKRINGGADGNTPIGVALIETTDGKLDDGARELLDRLLENDLMIIQNFMYHDYELHKEYPRNGEGF